MLFGNVAIFIFVSKIENDDIKLVVGAAVSLALFFVLLKLVRWLAFKSGISSPHLGNPKSFGIGLATGLLATIFCGFLYANQNEREINWSELKKETSRSVFTAITPATNEEAVFRFGWVHGAASLGGMRVGCAVGSVSAIDRCFRIIEPGKMSIRSFLSFALQQSLSPSSSQCKTFTTQFWSVQSASHDSMSGRKIQ